MPQLKNLDIRLKTMRVDNYTTIEKPTIYKQPKWSVNIGIGGGYGIINKKPDIYVGVTLGYNIWK